MQMTLTQPLASRPADLPPRYDARALTDEEGRAEIVLDGKAYTLRITRQGKLILTR